MLLFAAILSAAAVDAVEVGLDVSTQMVADLAWDRAAEDRFEVWTRLRADAAGPAGGGRWRIGVYAEHQVLIGVASGGGDTEAAFELRPWESGWEGPVGVVRLKAGHLIERWGQLDLLPVTDVLMGRDLRAGVLTPADLVRQPTPLVRIQAGGDRARGELSVLPFGAQDRLPIEGTDAALLRQGQVSRLLREASTWDGDALTAQLQEDALNALADGVDGMDHQLRQAAFGSLNQAGRPDPLLGTVDVAVRLEAEPTGVDLALVGAWMRSRRPRTATPASLVTAMKNETVPGLADTDALLEMLAEPVALAWPRTWVAGAEAAGTVGPMGVRAEALWQSNEVVNRAWGLGGTTPSLAGGVGLDWAWGTALTLVGEARYERLLDPPPDLILTAPDDVQVAAGGRVSVAGDRVTIEPGAVAMLTFEELAARLEVRWRITDAWQLSAGAIALLSDNRAPRRIQDALTYSGGPIGLVSDTDSAWVTARWIQ